MAQIFDLHFNPPSRSELTSGQAKLIFDSFCFEPANVYEKRLGSLYLVGELKNTLPQNVKFLDNLARVLKNQFYSSPIKSVERNLKESLKKSNEFLEGEVKKDNTSWLGNLNFAVISLKDLNLNFTKVGDLKIFLIRGGEIIDLGKKLELQEIEPYPLKIFLNIVSGKLTTNDIVFVANKEIFDHFVEENLFSEIAKNQIEGKFSEKELKKILRKKEKIFAQISGICLLILLTPEILPKKAISFEREAKIIPLQKIFQPFFTKIKGFLRLAKFPKISIKKPFLPQGLKKAALKKPEFEPFPKIDFQRFFRKITTFLKIEFSKELKKKLILIFALILFLIFGFFSFQREKRASFLQNQAIIKDVQTEISLAENFLNSKDEKKSNEIFEEAWQKILPLAQEKNAFQNEAQTLKDAIEKNLYTLNKLEKIETPQILFEFSEKDFSPQKMAGIDRILYFFNTFNNWFFKFEGSNKTKIETKENLNLAIALEKNSILFFSKPNTLILFENNQPKGTFSLKEPYSDFEFNDFSIFRQNLYFLDSKKGEILKYSYPPDSAKIWLNPETKKVIGAKSMTIDGSIWVLTQDNKIDRYFAGKYQQTLNLDIFPEPKNLEKIFTSYNLPYLFILEPVQKRIIILKKTGSINSPQVGQIVSQFQSEKFDNLKDFVVSFGERKIYLLNGQKIFQIKF